MNDPERLYQALIAPMEELMIRTVARVVRDPEEAEDAFQSALEKIWKSRSKLERHPNPQGYILLVCARCAYDQLRQRSRRQRREAAFCKLPSPPHDASESELEEQLRNISSALARLPRRQSEAVMLRYFGGQSFSQIGQTLGCTEATARSHVSKGLQSLRSQLKQA